MLAGLIKVNKRDNVLVMSYLSAPLKNLSGLLAYSIH